MKTTPMEHQVEGQARLDAAPSWFALAAEQGTGKTWMLLNDSERQFVAGRITGVLVVAPKGVHTNWVRREIPTHMSVPVKADYYLSGMGARRKARMQKVMRPSEDGELMVLAINIDALNSKDGYKAAETFLMHHEAIMIVDESSRIKTGSAGRTKKCIALGKLAKSRRIASGTMIANSPLDIFYQFEFLKPRGALLGTTSFSAFTAEFADVLPADHHLVRHAAAKSARGIAPQMIRKDDSGRPVFRNLEKLQKLMAPHTFRVLKKDCLDLPDKIYQTAYYELEPAARRVYDKAAEELRYERDCGEIDAYTALTKITKLQQMAAGFVMVDGTPEYVCEKNPRLALLKELVEDVDGQFIVWAVYREELRQIVAALKELGVPCVEYHGGVKDSDREHAVDSFQRGEARAFVGQAQAGGIGLTLTAATTAIYYSCNFSLELRLQSEDRCHRIGTKQNVVYIDIAGVDTIDERISSALQSKSITASAVLDGL
jgi:SNF2 family DNA or RNA helicase